MAALVWDNTGTRKYEAGVDHGVLYLAKGSDGSTPYLGGVAWNGLTAVTESPSGAEATDFWADNIKYGSLRSAEAFGGTIEAYTYPPEFNQCNGFNALMSSVSGVMIGQQTRERFGFCYRTQIGNDETDNLGYKLHLIYGATASPSERAYNTINDSPDAVTFSWEFDTNPVAITKSGYTNLKPTAMIEIDSTLIPSAKLSAIETILYGSDSSAPRLPLPDDLIDILA